MNNTIKKEVIIDNSTFTMWYYPEDGIIHHKIHKFLYGESFREMLIKGAEYFQKYKCKKWLSDDRNNSALRKRDLEWGSEVWKPMMVKYGWKAWGILLPDLSVGKMSMRGLITEYKEVGVDVEVFDATENALMWLRNYKLY